MMVFAVDCLTGCALVMASVFVELLCRDLTTVTTEPRFSACKMYLSPPLRWLGLVLRRIILLWLIYCLMYFPLFVGVLCLSLFCYALLCVCFSFVIILKRKSKLVALLLLSYRCVVTVNVLWLFFKMPWVGLQCVIVVFADHTYFLRGLPLHISMYKLYT